MDYICARRYALELHIFVNLHKITKRWNFASPRPHPRVLGGIVTIRAEKNSTYMKGGKANAV